MQNLRTPPEDATAKVIAAAHGSPRRSPVRERDLAFVLSMASTGCRYSELARLRFSDLVRSPDGAARALVLGKGHGQVRFSDLKGGVVTRKKPADKRRHVFFAADALRALDAYRLARGGDPPSGDWLFLEHCRGGRAGARTLRAVAVDLATSAGVRPHFRFTSHSLRHDFAVRAIRATGDLALVQDLLGHASPVSTRVYATLTVDDLARGHARVPPPAAPARPVLA